MRNEESLEVVLETMDATEVTVVKSLLEAAGIPYLTKGKISTMHFGVSFVERHSVPMGDRSLSSFLPRWRMKPAYSSKNVSRQIKESERKLTSATQRRAFLSCA
jgi:hypothetical protein